MTPRTANPGPCHDRCFYCDEGFADRRGDHQHDHFPIPKIAGGTDIVGACLTCHDFKDRFALGRWPMPVMAEAFRDLAGFLIYHTAALDVIAAFDDWDLDAGFYVDALDLPTWQTAWPHLGQWGRLYYAKILRLQHEYRHYALRQGTIASALPRRRTVA